MGAKVLIASVFTFVVGLYLGSQGDRPKAEYRPPVVSHQLQQGDRIDVCRPSPSGEGAVHDALKIVRVGVSASDLEETPHWLVVLPSGERLWLMEEGE